MKTRVQMKKRFQRKRDAVKGLSLTTQQRILLQTRKINSGSVLLFMNVRQRVDVAAISDRTLSYSQVYFLNFPQSHVFIKLTPSSTLFW